MGGINVNFNLDFLSHSPTNMSWSRTLFGESRAGLPGALPVWYARFRPYIKYNVGQIVHKVDSSDDFLDRHKRSKPNKFNLYVCTQDTSAGGISDSSFGSYFKSFNDLESDYTISGSGGLRSVSKSEWGTGGIMEDGEICLNLSEFVTMEKLICRSSLLPLPGSNKGAISLKPVSQISFGGGSARTISNQIFVTDIKSGTDYRIESPGNTDFIAIGASNNNVGTEFVANNSVPSGTGTVSEVVSGAPALDRYIVDFPEFAITTGSDGGVSSLPDRRFGFSETSLNAIMGASVDFINANMGSTDDISNSRQWNPSMSYAPGDVVCYNPPSQLADADAVPNNWSEQFSFSGFPLLAMCKKGTDGPARLKGGSWESEKTPWYGADSVNINEYWVKYDSQINRPNSSLASIYKYFTEKKFEIKKFSHNSLTAEINLAGQNVQRSRGRVRMADFTGASNILGHLLVKYGRELKAYNREHCRTWYSDTSSDQTGPTQNGGLDLLIYTKTLRKDHGGQPKLAVTFGSTTEIKSYTSHGASTFSTAQIHKSKINKYLQDLDYDDYTSEDTKSIGDLIHFQYRNLCPFYYMRRGYVHARRRGGVHPSSSKGSVHLGKYIMMVEDILSRQRIEFVTPQIFSNGNMYNAGHGTLQGLPMDHGQPKLGYVRYGYDAADSTVEGVALTELLSIQTNSGRSRAQDDAAGNPDNPCHYLILGNKLNRHDQLENAGKVFINSHVDSAFLPIIRRTDQMGAAEFGTLLGLLQTGFKGFSGSEFHTLTDPKSIPEEITNNRLTFEGLHFIDLGRSDLQQESIFSLTVDRTGSPNGNITSLDDMAKWNAGSTYKAGHMTRIERGDWWEVCGSGSVTPWRQDDTYALDDEIYVYQDDGEKIYYKSKQNNNRDFSPLQQNLFFKAKVKMENPGEDPISGGAPNWESTKWTRLALMDDLAIAPLSIVTQITIYDGWMKIFDSWRRGLSGSPPPTEPPINLGFEWFRSLDSEAGLALMSERGYNLSPWSEDNINDYKEGDLVTMRQSTPFVADPATGESLNYVEWSTIYPTTATTKFLDSAEYLFLKAEESISTYCFECIKDTDSIGDPVGVGIVPGIFPREDKDFTTYFTANLSEDLAYSRFIGRNIFSETTWLEISQTEFDNNSIDPADPGRLYAQHYGLEPDGSGKFKIQKRDLFGAVNYAYDLTYENYYKIGDAVKMRADEWRVKIKLFHYIADTTALEAAGFELQSVVKKDTTIFALEPDPGDVNSYLGKKIYGLPVSISSGTLSGFEESYSLIIRPGQYWRPVARREYTLDRTYPSAVERASGIEVQYFLVEGDFDFIHAVEGANKYAVEAAYSSRLSIFGPILKTYSTAGAGSYWTPKIRFPTTAMIDSWNPNNGAPDLMSDLYLARLDDVGVNVDNWDVAWEEGGDESDGNKFTSTFTSHSHPLAIDINSAHPAIALFRGWVDSVDGDADFTGIDGFNLLDSTQLLGEINPIKLNKVAATYPPELELTIKILDSSGNQVGADQVYDGGEINIGSSQSIKLVPKLIDSATGVEFSEYSGFITSYTNANALGKYVRSPIVSADSYSHFGLQYDSSDLSSILKDGEPALWVSGDNYSAGDEVVYDNFVWEANQQITDSAYHPKSGFTTWSLSRPAEFASRFLSQTILDESCLLSDDFFTGNRIEYDYTEISHRDSSTLVVKNNGADIGLLTENSSTENKLKESPKWRAIGSPSSFIPAWDYSQNFDEGDFSLESDVIYYAKQSSSGLQPSLFDSVWAEVAEWSDDKEYSLSDVVYREETNVIWPDAGREAAQVAGRMDPIKSELDDVVVKIFYSCIEAHNSEQNASNSFNPSPENILEASHGESEYLLRPFDNISSIFEKNGLDLRVSFDMESREGSPEYLNSRKDLSLAIFSSGTGDLDLFQYVFSQPSVLKGNLGFTSEFKLDNDFGGFKSTSVIPISVNIQNDSPGGAHDTYGEDYLDTPNLISKTYSSSAGLGWQNRFMISDGKLYASGLDSSELGYLGVSNYERDPLRPETNYGSTLKWNLDTYGRHHMCSPLKDAQDNDLQKVKVYENGSTSNLLTPEPEMDFVRSSGGNTVFITKTGELYGFGKNENNSLGITDQSFNDSSDSPENWGNWSHDLVDAGDKFDLLSYANFNHNQGGPISNNKNDPHLAGWLAYLEADHNRASTKPNWERMAWALFPINWWSMSNSDQNEYLRNDVLWTPEVGVYPNGVTPWWASDLQLRMAGRLLPWYDHVNFWKEGGVECVGFDKPDNGTNLILNSEDHIPFTRIARGSSGTFQEKSWGHEVFNAWGEGGDYDDDGVAIKQAWEFYGGSDENSHLLFSEQGRREAPMLAGFEGPKEKNMAGAAVLNDRGWMMPAWIYPLRDDPDAAEALRSWSGANTAWPDYGFKDLYPKSKWCDADREQTSREWGVPDWNERSWRGPIRDAEKVSCKQVEHNLTNWAAQAFQSLEKCSYEGEVWIAIENTTGEDVPGISDKWYHRPKWPHLDLPYEGSLRDHCVIDYFHGNLKVTDAELSGWSSLSNSANINGNEYYAMAIYRLKDRENYSYMDRPTHHSVENTDSDNLKANCIKLSANRNAPGVPFPVKLTNDNVVWAATNENSTIYVTAAGDVKILGSIVGCKDIPVQGLDFHSEATHGEVVKDSATFIDFDSLGDLSVEFLWQNDNWGLMHHITDLDPDPFAGGVIGKYGSKISGTIACGETWEPYLSDEAYNVGRHISYQGFIWKKLFSQGVGEHSEPGIISGEWESLDPLKVDPLTVEPADTEDFSDLNDYLHEFWPNTGPAYVAGSGANKDVHRVKLFDWGSIEVYGGDVINESGSTLGSPSMGIAGMYSTNFAIGMTSPTPGYLVYRGPEFREGSTHSTGDKLIWFKDGEWRIGDVGDLDGSYYAYGAVSNEVDKTPADVSMWHVVASRVSSQSVEIYDTGVVERTGHAYTADLKWAVYPNPATYDPPNATFLQNSGGGIDGPHWWSSAWISPSAVPGAWLTPAEGTHWIGIHSSVHDSPNLWPQAQPTFYQQFTLDENVDLSKVSLSFDVAADNLLFDIRIHNSLGGDHSINPELNWTAAAYKVEYLSNWDFNKSLRGYGSGDFKKNGEDFVGWRPLFPDNWTANVWMWPEDAPDIKFAQDVLLAGKVDLDACDADDHLREIRRSGFTPTKFTEELEVGDMIKFIIPASQLDAWDASVQYEHRDYVQHNGKAWSVRHHPTALQPTPPIGGEPGVSQEEGGGDFHWREWPEGIPIGDPKFTGSSGTPKPDDGLEAISIVVVHISNDGHMMVQAHTQDLDEDGNPADNWSMPGDIEGVVFYKTARDASHDHTPGGEWETHISTSGAPWWDDFVGDRYWWRQNRLEDINPAAEPYEHYHAGRKGGSTQVLPALTSWGTFYGDFPGGIGSTSDYAFQFEYYSLNSSVYLLDELRVARGLMHPGVGENPHWPATHDTLARELWASTDYWLWMDDVLTLGFDAQSSAWGSMGPSVADLAGMGVYDFNNVNLIRGGSSAWGNITLMGTGVYHYGGSDYYWGLQSNTANGMPSASMSYGDFYGNSSDGSKWAEIHLVPWGYDYVPETYGFALDYPSSSDDPLTDGPNGGPIISLENAKLGTVDYDKKTDTHTVNGNDVYTYSQNYPATVTQYHQGSALSAKRYGPNTAKPLIVGKKYEVSFFCRARAGYGDPMVLARMHVGDDPNVSIDSSKYGEPMAGGPELFADGGAWFRPSKNEWKEYKFTFIATHTSHSVKFTSMTLHGPGNFNYDATTFLCGVRCRPSSEFVSSWFGAYTSVHIGAQGIGTENIFSAGANAIVITIKNLGTVAGANENWNPAGLLTKGITVTAPYRQDATIIDWRPDAGIKSEYRLTYRAGSDAVLNEGETRMGRLSPNMETGTLVHPKEDYVLDEESGYVWYGDQTDWDFYLETWPDVLELSDTYPWMTPAELAKLHWVGPMTENDRANRYAGIRHKSDFERRVLSKKEWFRNSYYSQTYMRDWVEDPVLGHTFLARASQVVDLPSKSGGSWYYTAKYGQWVYITDSERDKKGEGKKFECFMSGINIDFEPIPSGENHYVDGNVAELPFDSGAGEDPSYQASLIVKSSYNAGDIVAAEVADGDNLFGTLLFVSMQDDNINDIGFSESLERVDGKKWTMPAPKAIVKTYDFETNTSADLVDTVDSASVSLVPHTLYNHLDYGGDKALQVEAGANHILIRTEEGNAFGVGDNSLQQIDWRNKTLGEESDFDSADRLGRNSLERGFYRLEGATTDSNPIYDSSWRAIEQPSLPPEKWAYGVNYSTSSEVWIDHVSHVMFVGPGGEAGEGVLSERQMQISIPSLTENGELESMSPAILKSDWADTYKLGKRQIPDVEVLTFGSIGEAMNALSNQKNGIDQTFTEAGVFGWFPLGRLSMIPNDGATHNSFPAPEIKTPRTSSFKLYKKAFGDTYFGTREVFMRPHLISHGNRDNLTLSLEGVQTVAASGNNSLIVSGSGDLFGIGKNKVSVSSADEHEGVSFGNVFGLESEFLDGPEFIFENVEFVSLQGDCATFISGGKSYKCGGAGLRPYLENYSFKGAPSVMLDDGSRDGKPILAKQVFMDSLSFWGEIPRRIRRWPQLIGGELCPVGSSIRNKLLPEINQFPDEWLPNKSYAANVPSGNMQLISGNTWDAGWKGLKSKEVNDDSIAVLGPTGPQDSTSGKTGTEELDRWQAGSAFIGGEPDFVTHRGVVYKCIKDHYLSAEPGGPLGEQYWKESYVSEINVGPIQYFYREWKLNRWATMSYVNESGELFARGFQTMYEPSGDGEIHQGDSYTALRSNAAKWADERISGWGQDLDLFSTTAIDMTDYGSYGLLSLNLGGADNEVVKGDTFGDHTNTFFGDANTNILNANSLLDTEDLDFTHCLMGSFVSGAHRPSTWSSSYDLLGTGDNEMGWGFGMTKNHVVESFWGSQNRGVSKIGWGSQNPFSPSFIRDFNKESWPGAGQTHLLDVYENIARVDWGNAAADTIFSETLLTSDNPPAGMYNWWQVMGQMQVDGGNALSKFKFMDRYSGPTTYDLVSAGSSTPAGHPAFQWTNQSLYVRREISPTDSDSSSTYSLFGGNFRERFNEDAWIVGIFSKTASQNSQWGIGPDAQVDGNNSPKNPRLDEASGRGKLTKILGLQGALSEGIPGAIPDDRYATLLENHKNFHRINFAATAMFGSWMCDPWSLPFGDEIPFFTPSSNTYPGDRVNFEGEIFTRILYSDATDPASTLSPLDSSGNLRVGVWMKDNLEKEHRWRSQLSIMHEVMSKTSSGPDDPYLRPFRQWPRSIGHSQIYTGFAERIGGHCLKFDYSDRTEKAGQTSLAVDHMDRVAGFDQRRPDNFSGLSEFDAFDTPGWCQIRTDRKAPIELTDTQGYTFANRETGASAWRMNVEGGLAMLNAIGWQMQAHSDANGLGWPIMNQDPSSQYYGQFWAIEVAQTWSTSHAGSGFNSLAWAWANSGASGSPHYGYPRATGGGRTYGSVGGYYFRSFSNRGGAYDSWSYSRPYGGFGDYLYPTFINVFFWMNLSSPHFSDVFWNQQFEGGAVPTAYSSPGSYGLPVSGAIDDRYTGCYKFPKRAIVNGFGPLTDTMEAYGQLKRHGMSNFTTGEDEAHSWSGKENQMTSYCAQSKRSFHYDPLVVTDLTEMPVGERIKWFWENAVAEGDLICMSHPNFERDQLEDQYQVLYRAKHARAANTVNLAYFSVVEHPTANSEVDARYYTGSTGKAGNVEINLDSAGWINDWEEIRRYESWVDYDRNARVIYGGKLWVLNNAFNGISQASATYYPPHEYNDTTIWIEGNHNETVSTTTQTPVSFPLYSSKNTVERWQDEPYTARSNRELRFELAERFLDVGGIDEYQAAQAYFRGDLVHYGTENGKKKIWKYNSRWTGADLAPGGADGGTVAGFAFILNRDSTTGEDYVSAGDVIQFGSHTFTEGQDFNKGANYLETSINLKDAINNSVHFSAKLTLLTSTVEDEAAYPENPLRFIRVLSVDVGPSANYPVTVIEGHATKYVFYIYDDGLVSLIVSGSGFSGGGVVPNNVWSYVGKADDSLGWKLTGAPNAFYSQNYADSGNKHEISEFWANTRSGEGAAPEWNYDSVGGTFGSGRVYSNEIFSRQNMSVSSRGSKMFASEEAAKNWIINRAKERERLGFSWYDHKIRKWVSGRNWLWENRNLDRISDWGKVETAYTEGGRARRNGELYECQKHVFNANGSLTSQFDSGGYANEYSPEGEGGPAIAHAPFWVKSGGGNFKFPLVDTQGAQEHCNLAGAMSIFPNDYFDTQEEAEAFSRTDLPSNSSHAEGGPYEARGALTDDDLIEVVTEYCDKYGAKGEAGDCTVIYIGGKGFSQCLARMRGICDSWEEKIGKALPGGAIAPNGELFLSMLGSAKYKPSWTDTGNTIDTG